MPEKCSSFSALNSFSSFPSGTNQIKSKSVARSINPQIPIPVVVSVRRTSNHETAGIAMIFPSFPKHVGNIAGLSAQQSPKQHLLWGSFSSGSFLKQQHVSTRLTDAR